MSTLQVVNAKHPSSASNNIVLDNAGNATFAGTAAMASSFLRNRIINGDMRIDQRNAGAAVTNANGYVVDRFGWFYGGAGRVTAQRSTLAPSGFTNSFGVTVTTTATPGANDFNILSQPIEGFNIADLGWGAAGAQTVTLSFWVRSSVTGTYGGAFRNDALNRSYPFTYSISAANTWEYKTITVAGDTTGTWLTNNGIGLNVIWGLGVGSALSGTAGAWAGSNLLSATGATNLMATNGATFFVTGVQLEVGTAATPFERRQFGQELALCQRYAYAWGGAGQYVATYSSGLYGDANQITMLPFGINFSGMRSLSATVTTVGTQGTDWAVQTSGGINQTGFTITSTNGMLNAQKTGHGITNSNSNLQVLTSSGRIIVATEL